MSKLITLGTVIFSKLFLISAFLQRSWKSMYVCTAYNPFISSTNHPARPTGHTIQPDTDLPEELKKYFLLSIVTKPL